MIALQLNCLSTAPRDGSVFILDLGDADGEVRVFWGKPAGFPVGLLSWVNADDPYEGLAGLGSRGWRPD
uniref:hypothetical protein n=1 Tax=Stenotrophomonas maltophilia TaxID=40324 RepID=UPI001952BFD6